MLSRLLCLLLLAEVVVRCCDELTRGHVSISSHPIIHALIHALVHVQAIIAIALVVRAATVVALAVVGTSRQRRCEGR